MKDLEKARERVGSLLVSRVGWGKLRWRSRCGRVGVVRWMECTLHICSRCVVAAHEGVPSSAAR